MCASSLQVSALFLQGALLFVCLLLQVEALLLEGVQLCSLFLQQVHLSLSLPTLLLQLLLRMLQFDVHLSNGNLHVNFTSNISTGEEEIMFRNDLQKSFLAFL